MTKPITLTSTNSTDARNIFYERILYELFFLSTTQDIDPKNIDIKTFPGIKDYWKKENILYGKVDKAMAVIEPIQEYMSYISQGDDLFYMLPEVADSYQEFLGFFKSAAKAGRLSSDNYLENIKIYRAYSDPMIEYNKYLIDIIENFNKKLFQDRSENKIKNIKDYSKEFFSYIMSEKDIKYLTKTSHILSSNVSALNSGLSIEIADLDPSRNADKQIILNSINFDFYKDVAREAGFLIDKNIPWRLNFDISSPANSSKLKGSGDVVQRYLNSRFLRARTKDIEYLLSTVILGYNDLVDKKGYYTENRCKFNRKSADKLEVSRDVLTENYWIKQYIKVKNKEADFQYTDSEIKKIIFNAIDLPRGRDDYIDKKFRFPFLQKGSTSRTTLEDYFLQNNNLSIDNFSEHVIILLKRSINELY